MAAGGGSERAAVLAGRLRAAGLALIDLVEGIDPDRWGRVPEPGVWSVGKEAAHVAEGMAYHQWIVRLTIGQRVGSQRPALERKEVTTGLAPRELAARLRERTDAGARVVESLTDEQLALPTRPPRARAQSLAETIERMVIGHIDGHRGQIASKLRLGAGPTAPAARTAARRE